MAPTTSSLFQNLVENLPFSITLFELISREEMDFKLVYANERASKKRGVDFQQLIGQNLRSVLTAAYEGNAAIPTAMMKALDTKKEVSLGLTSYVDEKIGSIVGDTTCIYVEENQVALLVKAVEKVESLTQELSIQQQMLKHGEEVAGLCTWVVNEKTGEVNFTQAYLAIHHFEEGEVNSQNANAACIARIHPLDKQKMEVFRTIKDPQYPASATYRYLLDEHSYIWLKDTISHRLPDGTLMGTTQDVTESRKTELEFEHSLKFQEKIMSTSPETIYVYDLIDQKNVFANKSLSSELGYSEAEVQELGEQFFPKTIHPDDLAHVFHHHGEILPNLQPNEVVKLQYRMKRKGGDSYVWLESAESIFEQDEAGNVQTVIGIARNIQQQKDAETTALKTNKELEHFIYSISHNLRAPVRHIDSYAESLKEEDGASLTEEGYVRLDRIIYSAKRLGSMIDQLLSYSRNRTMTPGLEKVDMVKLIHEIVGNFQEIENHKLQIKFSSPNVPVYIPCDRNLLLVVWENLVGNAIKYSRKRPPIEIEIGYEKKDTAYVFYIKDHGVGFDMTYVDKIFSVFQRLHPRSQFEGNGIGLAVTERIVKAHGGEIWAEGEVDKGATFYIRLPE